MTLAVGNARRFHSAFNTTPSGLFLAFSCSSRRQSAHVTARVTPAFHANPASASPGHVSCASRTHFRVHRSTSQTIGRLAIVYFAGSATWRHLARASFSRQRHVEAYMASGMLLSRLFSIPAPCHRPHTASLHPLQSLLRRRYFWRGLFADTSSFDPKTG